MFAWTVAGCLTIPLVYLGLEAFNITPVQMVVKATGRDMTLTDRTLLWTDIIDNAAKSPIVGVGMGAFWVGEIGYDLYPLPNWSHKTPGWRPDGGHNGFLDVYVELGVIGLLLFIAVIGAGFGGALDDLERNFSFGCLRITFLLAVLLNNVAETSFLKGTHDLWFLLLLVAINQPRLYSRPLAKISEASFRRSSVPRVEHSDVAVSPDY
jgi:O-antigen ligase